MTEKPNVTPMVKRSMGYEAEDRASSQPLLHAGQIANDIVNYTKKAIETRNPQYVNALLKQVIEFRKVMRDVEEEIGNKLFKSELVTIVNGNILSIYDITSYTDMLIGEALKFHAFVKYLILGDSTQKQYAINYLGEIQQRLELFIPSLQALIKLAEA